jgi:hypothetical protein
MKVVDGEFRVSNQVLVEILRVRIDESLDILRVLYKVVVQKVGIFVQILRDIPCWIFDEQSPCLLLIASQALEHEVRMPSKEAFNDVVVALEELNHEFFPLG